MRLSSMKDGEYLYSEVTDIMYSRKDGVLIKFPMYADDELPDRRWADSGYSLDDNHFVKPTKQKMKLLKDYEEESK